MKHHLTIDEAKHALSMELNPFVVLLKDKQMSVEYFAPKGVDAQTPHAQNELYVIASGSGELCRDGEICWCTTGDVLFVPAGMVHRFQNFSEDFATWVIFY